MAYIYKNYKGDEVSTWSYSSGSTFAFCRQKFKLQKVVGWRTKGDTAAAKFGVAVEDAIQHFHSDNMKPESGVDHFRLRWLQFREVPNLIYKEKEGSWEDFRQAGVELLQLYELTVPTLPITRPEFQLRYKKEVFPGTELEGIEDQGFTDMLSRAEWNHPMLPKVPKPPDAQYRPVIIDIKVSGKGLDATPNMLQMDPQLRRYAWLSSVQDVAFLWFQRSKPYSYEKGTEVTFLESSGKWAAGQKAVIYEYDDEAKTAIVAPSVNMDSIKKAMDEIKGKGTKARCQALLAQWLSEDVVSQVPMSVLTKQRLQFVSVRIDQEAIIEEGMVVGKQIVDARQADSEDFWPHDGAGVRFPKQNCVWCDMRGICLKDDRLRDNLLVQINPAAAPEEDWLDSMEEE